VTGAVTGTVLRYRIIRIIRVTVASPIHALIERLTVVSQSKLSLNLGILFVVRLVGCSDENLKDIPNTM
jgi:hypothetical protein